MEFVYILITASVGIIAPWLLKVWLYKRLPWEFVGIVSFAALCASAMIIMPVAAKSYADVEIWNGLVTAKKRETVDCEHSYDCNCRTVTQTYNNSDGTTSTSSHEECDTCYRHDEDYDWLVKSSIGNFRIRREDDQGVRQPKRWTLVKQGEPVSDERHYLNYIKGSADSLFYLHDIKMPFSYPEYPSVTDYYKFERIISLGGAVTPEFVRKTNMYLNYALGTVSPQKQVNVIVVFTNESNNLYGEGLRHFWQNGKKNDVIIVVGVKDYKPIWTKVFSLAESEIINIRLQDKIQAMESLTDPTAFSGLVIETIKADYARKPMALFKYLTDNQTFPMWALLTAFFLSSFVGIGVPCFIGKQSR